MQKIKKDAWRRAAKDRTGLAPLELVLCLFFLLVLMSLIINFGTTAPWHLRGSIAARDAVWRSLAIRTGNSTNRPNPANWWAPGQMGMLPARQFTTIPNDQVGPVWNQGDLTQPALRGPVITDPSTGKQILMNDLQYLEMINQAVIGSATLTKAMPLIPNMRQASINPMQPVLDHYWRFQDMGIDVPALGFGYNDNWRLKGWYRIEANMVGDGNLMQLFMQFQMADMKIQQNSGAQALLTLDRDPEFPPWGMNSPDVYPRLNGCDASPQDVQNLVMPPPPMNGLVGSIQGPTGGGRGGVPQKLAQAFINLYNQQKAYYQAQTPPDEAKIQQLQQLIDQLNQFIGGS